MPAIGFEACRGVVTEPAGSVAVDGDLVVVPERDQLTQAPGTGQRGRLVRDALHHATVAHEHPGAVVDDFQLGPVITLCQQLLGQREPDCIGKALPKRPGGGFHPRRFAALGVAGGLAVQLTELLELLDRQVVAGQVQQRVLQHRPVPVGQHETVAIEPLRIVRVVPEEIVPQHFGDIGHAHGHAGVAGLCGFDRIGGEETDGVGQLAAGGLGHGRLWKRRGTPLEAETRILPQSVLGESAAGNGETGIGNRMQCCKWAANATHTTATAAMRRTSQYAPRSQQPALTIPDSRFPTSPP